MAPADRLDYPIKRFIVQALARFETPTDVAKAVKDEFGLTLTRQRVQYYDPNTVAGRALDPELAALFKATRGAFLTELDDIPIAHKAVRLRLLNAQVIKAAAKGAMLLVRDLCEAAAKEVGGAFTNEQRLKHSGPNGEALPVAHGAVIILPDNHRGDVTVNINSGSAAGAGEQPGGNSQAPDSSGRAGDGTAGGTADQIP